jgi:multiple sugar transport system permease protein
VTLAPARDRTTAPAPPRRRRSRLARSERTLGIVLILPVVLVIALLVLVPLAGVVWDSLGDRTFLSNVSHFVGLSNYTALLSSGDFWQVFGHSVGWTVASVTLQLVIGLALALLLNRRMPARPLFRGLFLLPWVTPVVVIVLIWKWMLNDLYGVVNALLGAIHPAWHSLSWFSDPALALPTVIAINVWRGAPFVMVIFLAGLQTVPRELHEAAALDGAGPWRSFWHVTLPHLRAILATMILIFALFNFNNFDLIYLATQGGPANATMTLPVNTYQVGFGGELIGQASTWAVLMLVTVLLVALVYAVPRWVRRRQA